MIKFVSKFPFIKYVRNLTANDYHQAISNEILASEENKTLMKNCKELLTENRIPLNKIKFVYGKSFTYDIDNNVINPKYKTILPIKKKHPVIEIGKPLNTITVFLGENRTHNNFGMLKQLTKASKRGIALLVSEDLEDIMWLASLDDAVDYYKTLEENFEYNS